jgi:hypothetical protein
VIYPGVYQGFVVVVGDSDNRSRVCVRVPEVHSVDADDACPVAEIIAPGSIGKMRGSFANYRTGDRVWVMFQKGNALYPVILGGWFTNGDEVPDGPIENQLQPEKAHLRQIQSDGKGNTIILSEAGDENHVRIKSGGAAITVTQIAGGGISVKAESGVVEVQGAQVNVVAGTASISSNNVTIDAIGHNLLGQDSGFAGLRSNDRTDVYADTDLNEGGNSRFVVVAGSKITDPSPASVKQTTNHNLRAQNINVGVAPSLTSPSSKAPLVPYPDPTVMTEGTPPATLLPTLTINLRSVGPINIQSSTFLNLYALAGATLQADGFVSVSAQGNVDVYAAGAATVESLGAVTVTAGGAVTATAAGPATITSATVAAITAPIITLTGIVTTIGAFSATSVVATGGSSGPVDLAQHEHDYIKPAPLYSGGSDSTFGGPHTP